MTKVNAKIIAATALGWITPVPERAWPDEFEYDGKTWQKDHLTVAQKIGEVQTGEYKSGEEWLIVFNE